MALTLEQKEARKSGIGGSDAAAVVGLSPFKTPFQLYCEKRGEVPENEEETLAMKFGTLLEEPIVSHYCDVTGRQVRRQPMTAHTDHPFMLANIDRQILKDPRGPGILEVKTTNEWSGRGIHTENDIPDHYFIQAQHYLAVYGYDWASLAILIGGQRFVWFDVQREQAVIDELIRQEAAFWERVQAGNPPPIDGSERTGELIKRMYPRDNGKIITLDAEELKTAAAALVGLKATLKAMETEKVNLENILKSAIGDASVADVPGWGAITWKRAKDSVRTSLDMDKLKADYPEVVAACTKTETVPGSRRFLLKPAKGEQE